MENYDYISRTGSKAWFIVLIIILHSTFSILHSTFYISHSTFYIIKSRPKLLFLFFLHLAATARTGGVVPHLDALAATMQAQPSHLAAERRRHIAYHPTHNDVLNGVTVGATDGSNMLPEESFALIGFRFVTATCAAVFQFPSHYYERGRGCVGNAAYGTRLCCEASACGLLA